MLKYAAVSSSKTPLNTNRSRPLSLTPSQRQQIVSHLKTDFAYFAERQLLIRAKTGELVPLKLNKAQQYLLKRIQDQIRRTGKVRLAVLKGRQQGASTFIGAYLYWRTITRKGTLTFIFAHDSDGSSSLYKMVQTYYHDGVYDDLKPTLGAASQKEMTFPLLGSSYKVGTAGTSGLGRSKTIQQLHWSEVAYSPNCDEHAMGIMQAVPDAPDTAVFLESTSNGQGDFFHRTCMQALQGQGDFELVFIPWYWQDEYARELPSDWDMEEDERELLSAFESDGLRQEHLCWRRAKILNDFHGDVNRFKREYPFTPSEAFEANDEESFIKASLVRRAINHKIERSDAPLVFGVDPARLGGDSFRICHRKGRVVTALYSLPPVTLDRAKYLLAQEIHKYQPAKVYIDAGGLGVGVYDELRAMGYSQVVKIDFGGSATNSQKFRNKRAEMYGSARDWLEDWPCSIECLPAEADKLQSELSIVKPRWINNSQLQMLSKEDIKKELGYSPDSADAFILTFAQPIAKTATQAGLAASHRPITLNQQWSPI